MSNDFFNEEEGRSGVNSGGDSVSVDFASERDENRLMRQKKELDGRVVVAANEIDLLKRRQSELEARKVHMEEISKKQTKYEKNKHDIIEKLNRSLILLEKEELQATRMVDLLSDTRARFKAALAEVRSIQEDKWSDVDFEESLDKAIVHVENASSLHQKGLSKVDVISEHKKGRSLRRHEHVEEDDNVVANTGHSFGYWLKAGLAFTLPAMSLAIVLLVIYLFLNNLLTII